MTPKQEAEMARVYGVALAKRDKAVWNSAIERAAALATAKIDPEWPGDDLSSRAKNIEAQILELKH